MITILKKYPLTLAVATLIGMIIGAGTFGIPFAVSRSGAIVGLFYLFLIGLAVMFIHLIYGEIILRTGEACRWAGCVEQYFGAFGKKIASLIMFFQFYGSMLAYMILGGDFLKIIFGRFLGAPDDFWVLLFFIIAVLAIARGTKTMGWSEFLMTAFMFLAIAWLFVKGINFIKLDNFSGGGLTDFFLPYGVIFFALTGAPAIPEMRQILRGKERKLPKAIILGTLIPMAFYAIFTFLVLGITGPATTPDAVSGLAPYLGAAGMVISAIFGIFAVMSSYVVLGVNMQESLYLDFGVKKQLAFILTAAVPLFLYLLGLKSFILIIGFIGAVFSGLDGLFMVLVYWRAKKRGDRQPEYALPKFKLLSLVLALIFSAGLIYQFVYLF